jgi:hypothetical protein
MRRILPVVHSKAARQNAILHGLGGDQGRERLEIILDSEEWFIWLATEQSFRFTYWQEAGQFVNITVRPEKRDQRSYWQGWKTIRGRTTKKYIGAAAKMNKTKLDEVGQWFFEQVQVKSEANQEMELYAAVTDLSWLVEQLMEHCPQPVLVRQAQRELERIRRNFGN